MAAKTWGIFGERARADAVKAAAAQRFGKKMNEQDARGGMRRGR